MARLSVSTEVERNHLRVRGRHLRCPCDWEHVLPEECIKLYVLTSNDLVLKLGCDGWECWGGFACCLGSINFIVWGGWYAA